MADFGVAPIENSTEGAISQAERGRELGCRERLGLECDKVKVGDRVIDRDSV